MPNLQNKLYALIIGLVILTSTFVIFRFLRKDKKPTPPLSIEKEEKAEVIAHNITLKELSPNKVKGWEITSKTAKFFKHKKDIECNDVNCKLIMKNNKIAYLHSEKTKINKSKDIFLEGPVSGNFDEFQLSGKNFEYSFKNHTLSTSSPLILKHPLLKIFSNKTFIELKKKKISFFEEIKSEFNIDELQQQPSRSSA